MTKRKIGSDALPAIESAKSNKRDQLMQLRKFDMEISQISAHIQLPQ